VNVVGMMLLIMTMMKNFSKADYFQCGKLVIIDLRMKNKVDQMNNWLIEMIETKNLLHQEGKHCYSKVVERILIWWVAKKMRQF
jgi:hypothetical protein